MKNRDSVYSGLVENLSKPLRRFWFDVPLVLLFAFGVWCIQSIIAVRHQNIWHRFGCDLEGDWPHLMVVV
jgi:hypothetical protein